MTSTSFKNFGACPPTVVLAENISFEVPMINIHKRYNIGNPTRFNICKIDSMVRVNNNQMIFVEATNAQRSTTLGLRIIRG